ncbi:hypothetical protein ACYZX9_04315 [Sphingomonas citri]
MDDRRQAEPQPTDVNRPAARSDDSPDEMVPVERSGDVQEAEAHPS